MSPAPTTLVTGAGGYVGRGLARALDCAGHRLLLVDRTFHPDEGVPYRDARRITGDVRDLPVLMSEAAREERVDHVIHAAAITASPNVGPAWAVAYLEEHTAAAFAALALAARHRATAVLISSAAVFAPTQRGDLDEHAATTGTGPYATAKRAMELVWEEAARAGARAATVRLGNLYGADEGASLSRPRVSLARAYADAALAEGRIVVERPDALRDWTYLPDVAVRIAGLLDDPRALPARLHVVAPEACTDLELARSITRRVPGTRVDVRQSPRGPIRGVLRSGVGRLQGAWTSLDEGLDALIGPRLADPRQDDGARVGGARVGGAPHDRAQDDGAQADGAHDDGARHHGARDVAARDDGAHDDGAPA